MEHYYEIGDRVIYVINEYGDYLSNPLWNGKQGQVVGTVAKIYDDEYIEVDWDNGQTNDYKPRFLEPYHETPTFSFDEDLFTL